MEKRVILNIFIYEYSVQNILENLNDSNEFNQILYDFLENKTDYINLAEQIIDELEILSDYSNFHLNDYDCNLDIEFNFELFNNNFENFCRLNIKEIENVNIAKMLEKIKTKRNFPHHDYVTQQEDEDNLIKNKEFLKNNNSMNNSFSNSFLSLDEYNKILTTENSSSQLSYLSTCPSKLNLSTVNLLSSDKIVFIKNQLRNEIANFSGYSICDEGAKKISELLLSTQFSYSPSKRTTANKVKELKFTNSGVGDEGFSHLSNCLERSNSINSIVMNKNKLKDESYTNILNLIKNNKQLRFLNLTSNLFSNLVKEKIKNISKNLNPSLKIEI